MSDEFKTPEIFEEEEIIEEIPKELEEGTLTDRDWETIYF